MDDRTILFLYANRTNEKRWLFIWTFQTDVCNRNGFAHLNERYVFTIANFHLILCLIVPTTVEYLSGLLTRHIFHQDYWDYSMLKFNLQGLICPQFSICWMILTFIGVNYFQPMLVDPFINQHFSSWFVICPFICGAFMIDEALTLKKFIRKHAIIKKFLMKKVN